MCVMEVRPGQHHATIAQAMAHNVQTVVSDLEMFRAMLLAREDRNALAVQRASAKLAQCESDLLDIFAQFVTDEVVKDHHDEIGSERDISDIARSVAEKDRTLARKFETR